MVSIGWAVIIAIVSGGLGIVFGGSVRVGKRYGQCDKCAFAEYRDRTDGEGV